MVSTRSCLPAWRVSSSLALLRVRACCRTYTDCVGEIQLGGLASYEMRKTPSAAPAFQSQHERELDVTAAASQARAPSPPPRASLCGSSHPRVSPEHARHSSPER